MFNNSNKKILVIILSGLFIRLIFTYIIAPYYFNRENIYVDGDTSAWAACFQNLFEHGSYSVDLDNEYGYFGRLPGYSFFIGFFWIFIRDWNAVYPVIAMVQILLDVISIFLVYKISIKIFKSHKISYLAAGTYSLYPFIIIWNPVVYSESVSVFLMLASLYLLVNYNKRRNIFLSGLILGVSVLFRPQIIFFLPAFLLYLFFALKSYREKIISCFFICLFFIVGFGAWPLRNYLNHKKVILTQDLRGFDNWNEDVIAFMQYIYSIKGEWEPQFSSIIHNEKVEFPPVAYSIPGDSAKLEKVVGLCKTCGEGFSYWPGYWKGKIPADSSCTSQIAGIFDELRMNQMSQNPVNYWIKVPLQNLKKALFKSSLYDSSGFLRKAASLLFFYRSFIIFLGIFGLIVLFKRNKPVFFLFSVFFLITYIYLCAGTGPQVRNIEMRYFLHADIALVFPGIFSVQFLWNKTNFIRKKR